MKSPKMIYNINQYKTLINVDSITTDILEYIKSKPESIPKDVTVLGVARNVAIGVFAIIKRDNQYYCKRICMEQNLLVVSDIEYPVSNMGDTPYGIELNMDYIIYMRFLKIIQNEAL